MITLPAFVNLMLMRTENSVVIDAPLQTIFNLAACTEQWPEIIPNYRSATLLRERGDVRLFRMVGTRDGFPFPLHWTSVQEVNRNQRIIRFRQVRGITRGMLVEWTMEPVVGGVKVRIVHVFTPSWPSPLGPLIAQHIVGNVFVHSLADKTLQGVKAAAEARESNDVPCAPRDHPCISMLR